MTVEAHLGVCCPEKRGNAQGDSKGDPLFEIYKGGGGGDKKKAPSPPIKKGEKHKDGSW